MPEQQALVACQCWTVPAQAEPVPGDESGHAMPDRGGSAKSLLSLGFRYVRSWLEVQRSRLRRGITSGGGSWDGGSSAFPQSAGLFSSPATAAGL